jgi:hypothetical protein
VTVPDSNESSSFIIARLQRGDGVLVVDRFILGNGLRWWRPIVQDFFPSRYPFRLNLSRWSIA